MKMIEIPTGSYTKDPNDLIENTVSSFFISEHPIGIHEWKKVYELALNEGEKFDSAEEFEYLLFDMMHVSDPVLDTPELNNIKKIYKERLQSAANKEGSKEGLLRELLIQSGSAKTTGENDYVSSVNWKEIIIWCNAKSKMEGLTPAYKEIAGRGIGFDQNSNGYRLPTLNEWMYVAIKGIPDDMGIRGRANQFGLYGMPLVFESYDSDWDTLHLRGMENRSEWIWDKYTYEDSNDEYRTIVSGGIASAWKPSSRSQSGNPITFRLVKNNSGCNSHNNTKKSFFSFLKKRSDTDNLVF